MKDTAILGIDIGTSSCKAIAVGLDGALLASATASYPLSIPREGWSEQNPDDWIKGARMAIAEVTGAIGSSDFTAIGLTGQMHGLTPLDRDLSVIRPAILWNDQRTEAECQQITEAAGGLEGLLAMTNNPMLPGYTGGKIVWMRNHEPQHFERMAHALNPKDYLRLRLTGEIATEVSDASGTGLFDVANRCWSKPLLEKTGIDAALLPRCTESQAISGTVSNLGAELFGVTAETPVVGGGGDAVVQTIGSGVVSANMLQTTIGTAGIVATALDSTPPNPDGRLQLFCNVTEDLWHCMGVSLNAGGAFSWLRSVLAGAGEPDGEDIDFSALVERAEAAPPGSHGLLFLPYLWGERCPWPDPSARAAFVGLTAGHGDSHLIRALLEGVVFALADMASLMTEMGLGEVARIHASGGGSSAPLWNQIQADVFGTEVATVRGAAEGAAYGAALVAGLGTGIWGSPQEVAALCAIEGQWEPDAGNATVYKEMLSIYQELYLALRPAFRRLRDRSSAI